MTKEKSHPKAAQEIHSEHYADLSAEAQRRRLMDVLRCGSVTTLEARRDLDILMPAARVFELRAEGHQIETVWTRQATDAGRQHRVARYVLQAEAGT